MMRCRTAILASVILAGAAAAQFAPPASSGSFLSAAGTAYDNQVPTSYSGLELGIRAAPTNNKYVTAGSTVSTGNLNSIPLTIPAGGGYVGDVPNTPGGLGSPHTAPATSSILDKPGITLVSPLGQ